MSADLTDLTMRNFDVFAKIKDPPEEPTWQKGYHEGMAMPAEWDSITTTSGCDMKNDV